LGSTTWINGETRNVGLHRVGGRKKNRGKGQAKERAYLRIARLQIQKKTSRKSWQEKNPKEEQEKGQGDEKGRPRGRKLHQQRKGTRLCPEPWERYQKNAKLSAKVNTKNVKGQQNNPKTKNSREKADGAIRDHGAIKTEEFRRTLFQCTTMYHRRKKG